ncbi:hypothetical protein Cpir12675_000746 [Ceratocystis pirilliformis]|uniref:Leptomycin B resistance protein pmd1 n=1 Tax=Ceratocystis pirilliformis TaxID=259994 RepID=A0ABR3ZLF2_9PEZI
MALRLSRSPVSNAAAQGKDTATSVAAIPLQKKFSGLSYFRLLLYSNPTWFDIFLLITGFFSSIAAGIPMPLMAILFGELIDDMSDMTCASNDSNSTSSLELQQAKDRYQDQVNDKVVLLLYAASAGLLLIYIYAVSWSLFSQRLSHRIRDRYFSALLRKDAEFFDTRPAGEVSSKLNNDIQTIQTGTSEKVGLFTGSLSFFVAAYVVAFTRDPEIAGILVSALPAFLLMGFFGSKYTQKFAVSMSEALAKAASIASEALSHAAVVQAFGAAPRLESKFAASTLAAQKAGIKKAVATAIQAGLLYFIAYSANALAYWKGAMKIADTVAGKTSGSSVGQIYSVVFILVDACIVLGQIAPLLPVFGAAAGAFDRLVEDIEHECKINGNDESLDNLSVDSPGALEFNNVVFSYPSRPDNPALRGLSLSCPSGKHTAIVGPSGSGKSSLASLMVRLYDPTSGSATFDGRDLRSVSLRSLRSMFSIVQQEPSLLSRSILENIALGLVNSPRPKHKSLQETLLGTNLKALADKICQGEDMMTAASTISVNTAIIAGLVKDATDMADASAFIDHLQDNYGTNVGSSGGLISGGQRQRLALARALIRNPKILILDEATASLDSESEQRIQASIDRVAQGGRTIISIAHRLSTVKKADNIVFLKDGQIQEQGTHSQLMAQGSLYYKMVHLQDISHEESGNESNAKISIKNSSSLGLGNDEMAQSKFTDGLNLATSKVSIKYQADQEEEVIKKLQLDEQLSFGTVLKRLFSLIRPDIMWLLVAFFAATLVGSVFSGAGIIFGNTVGRLSPCHEPDYIRDTGRLFGGMMFMLAVIEFFANLVSWSAFGYVAEKLLFRVRVLAFRSLFEQSMDFHESEDRSPSTLLSLITKDTSALSGFSGSIMGQGFAVFVNLVFAIILSHIVNWRIALVCLVVIPLMLGAGILQYRELAKYEMRYAGAFSSAVAISVEAVNSIKTVSALSLDQEILESYRRALDEPRKGIFAAAAFANIWLALANSLGNIIYAFAYWWGAKQIIAGHATQADFFIIMIAMLVGAQLWGQMFALAPEVSRARSAASRLIRIIDMGSTDCKSARNLDRNLNINNSKEEPDGESHIVTSEKTLALEGSHRGVSVEFQHVSFSYPARPDIKILDDTSFRIEAGQFCGLVGPSGAGKSTIMSLVQRMYSCTSGSITLGEKEISRDDVTFRDDTAIVPQDPTLFDGTIHFNVGLGARPGTEANQEDIIIACKLANIHETIMALPDGYDTECGPNGSRLSGGQRQRLAIARALVRKPRLLLLDESTSALDAESERVLQDSIDKASAGITVIAVTHRLHTVCKADVILMIEKGAVVARGTHGELMATNETYRNNATHQMLST